MRVPWLLMILTMAGTGGCSSTIAGKLLIPAVLPARVEELAEARRQVGHRLGDRLKAFDYHAEDGTRLAAFLMLPERKARGVVVVLHGLTDRKEAVLSIAERFAEEGYIAVTPDLRAHGLSGGVYTSLGFHERRDMMALLDYLEPRGCDVSHVGVVGGSLGAAVGLQWAGVDSRVRAVVAVASFAELRTELDFLYRVNHISALKAMVLEPAAQKEGRFKIRDVSPLGAISGISTPVLLAHGRQDDVIPVSESRRLFEAARGPVVLEEVDSDHLHIRDVLGEAFLEHCVAWINAFVPGRGAPGELGDWVEAYPHRSVTNVKSMKLGKL